MASLKPGNEKKPPASRLVTIDFRPPFSEGHLVSDGENWESVGARYHIAALDLISMNFQTTVPEEVNWYLREYVKCDTTTPDRYNWRFSTSSRSGGGPRAGTIFVPLNWSVIGRAAREATAAWVRDWFSHAMLKSATVEGAALTYFPGQVVSTSFHEAKFLTTLRGAGASDRLAHSWMLFLVDWLRRFTAGIHGRHANAFPHFLTLPAGVPLSADRATPWPILAQPNLQEGLLNPLSFQQIIFDAQVGSPVAHGAMLEYGNWFVRAFRLMRERAIAIRVNATAVRMPMMPFPTGTAFASPGFIEQVHMPDPAV